MTISHNLSSEVNILGITQARLGSSRLPEKVLKKIQNLSLLDYHLLRAKKSQKVNKWVVATTKEIGVEKIVQIAAQYHITTYQGSMNNVLERFYLAAEPFNPKVIIRITSDCPLIDPQLIDFAIDCFEKSGKIYYSNHQEDYYVKGLDVEVFLFSALKDAYENAHSDFDKEHVTPFLIKKSGIVKLTTHQRKYSDCRITVDEPLDLEVVKKIINSIGYDKDWKTYIDFLNNHPEIKDINKHLS